jgi:G:T-mismatch repair DNA endonuclease (very short patch repair protein)
MADVHNKTTRSTNKSRIKGKNTKPELKISGAKCWCGSFCFLLVFASR